MFTFKNTSWFFGSLLLIMMSLDLFFELFKGIYLLLYLLYSACFFYGCFVVKLNFFTPIICSVNTTKKVIALSFDDGPHPQITSQILAILKQYHVKATFFCIGQRIVENPAQCQQIHQQGHLIGNHSQSHNLAFTFSSVTQVLLDLHHADQIIEKTTQLKTHFFRPPFGVTNPFIHHALLKSGHTTIGWSVRSFDTCHHNEKILLSKLVRSIQTGAIFLLHDTQQNTVNILPDFLQQLHAKGYQAIRVDQLLSLPN